jgi:hypothetical protein
VEDRALTHIVVSGLGVALLAGFCAYLIGPLNGDTAGNPEPTTSGSEQQVLPVLPEDHFPSFRDFSQDNNLGHSGSIAHAVSYFDSLTVAPGWAPSSADYAQVGMPLPPRRPQQLSSVTNGLLNDAQITGIKSRLKLSPKQAEYWPDVEEALRDVARRHLQGHGRLQNSAPAMDVKSPEVQRLVQVSVPLIRELREDQKRELRQLVRMIGLGTVALHI